MPGGFTLDDFTIDPDHTVTCPAGHTRPITARRNVTFGALCRDCPLRDRCTTGKRGRKLALHEHEDLLRTARRHAETDAFEQTYRQHRPMVERTIAWLVAGGNRRPRYRGVARNNQWLHHRVAALNLRRLRTLGLTRDHATWVLA